MTLIFANDFFFNWSAPLESYTLSLHDALPILVLQVALAALVADRAIQRVVDEQELHHPVARLLDHRRVGEDLHAFGGDRKSTRLNSSHPSISYAVFCLKKKKNIILHTVYNYDQ